MIIKGVDKKKSTFQWTSENVLLALGLCFYNFWKIVFFWTLIGTKQQGWFYFQHPPKTILLLGLGSKGRANVKESGYDYSNSVSVGGVGGTISVGGAGHQIDVGSVGGFGGHAGEELTLQGNNGGFIHIGGNGNINMRGGGFTVAPTTTAAYAANSPNSYEKDEIINKLKALLGLWFYKIII